VVVIAAIVIYFTAIRSDAPDEFVLTDQSAESGDADSSGSDDAGSSEADSGSGDSSADTGSDTADDGPIELDGTWSVAAGSEAGYRVVEDLRGITDFEAVGRTDQVTGSVEIAGTVVNSASFEVDVASISSDDNMRDGQFTGPIMNTAEFPTASLVLTSPIDLGAIPTSGEAVSTQGTAELTLRGATNQATVPINAQLLGNQIEIVASVDVLFSDYGIDNPTNPFVTVRDEGKVEVRLLLDKN
jgi:polyisoprenoid-binding protein YceI